MLKKGNHKSSRGSSFERTIRYRRKAIVRIYFGLFGILAGVLLVVLRIGLSSTHVNEVILGIFTFIAGYLGVISGCACWLKAKEGNEGIVFIGFMPLAIIFIPFVRLLLFAVPGLLALAMAVAPLILIVVVFCLPDRSGFKQRRRERQRIEDLAEIEEPVADL
jgi:hypothetical protein